MKKILKQKKGITLIALVITIIVLLILAGISISMLAGDNGILQKVTDAKEKTERQSVIEQARTDVLGYQAENKGTDLNKVQLQSVLEKYFKDVPDLTDMKESEILKTKLDTLPNYGDYNIEVDKIFNGRLLGDNPIQTTISDEINTKIGTIVSGYNAQNLEWQVYYADENETFLISSTHIETSYDIPQSSYTIDTMNNATYITNWNAKWLSKSPNISSRRNAKMTVYMCDPDNWSSYQTGIANYAVGGPTIELLLASYNKSQGESISLLDSNVDDKGVFGSFISSDSLGTSTNLFTSTMSNGIYYNSQGDYYLATPYSSSGVSDMLMIKSGEFADTWRGMGFETTGIRPIVSIPTSKISVNGDIVTVLP